jgi:hypothetical protein
MTEQEFLDLITRNKARVVLKRLAEIPEADRRQFGNAARKIFQRYDTAWYGTYSNGKDRPEDIARDGDALCIAMLATGVPSEFIRFGWRSLPKNTRIASVFAALKPSWIDRWAEVIVEENPRHFSTVQELHHQGLCHLPNTDAYIMGYYAHNQTKIDLVSDAFLKTDIWRFFEVEGGGEFSLASHDKYTSDANAWSTVISTLSAEGRLDRDRLLDASLDALERDFGQFRAGWYSRFHMKLAPTPVEMVVRTPQYLRLLGSMVPPTVSFSLKVLKQIDKAGALSPNDLLTAIEPGLQARQKSSAISALQLLKSCARKHPERSADVASAAVAALISEAGEVQESALDLIEQLDQTQNPKVLNALADFLDTATPSIKPRLSQLLGTRAADTEDPVAYPVPQQEALEPVRSAEEAVAIYLQLLEECADPFLMERAMDGVARFGAEASHLLSPLAKRASQIQKREADGGYSPGKYYQRSISTTALAWASGNSFEEEFQPLLKERYSGHRPFKIKKDSFEGLFAARSQEILGFVQSGHAVPLLSAPTDNRGYLSPTVLVARVQEYRSLGLQPGITDYKLALMRLAPEARDVALTDLRPATEADRALAYAMGADFPHETDKQLWAIAWSSRLPLKADPAIQTLVGGQVAGAGTPAGLEFDAYRYHSHGYSWPMPRIVVSPPITGQEDQILAFGMLHKDEPIYGKSLHANAWMAFANPWVSIARPAHSELYFAAGILELELDQKLAAHPCQAFLDPFFRPGCEPAAMAHALLAWYLAAADGAIGSVTTDGMATIIAQDKFDPSSFADAARKLVFQAGLPLRRWTQRMREISAISQQHADAVRVALSELLSQLPEDLPRDLGGILELLYELHIASETQLQNADLALSFASINAGGKAGKFAKKLASLSTS